MKLKRVLVLGAGNSRTQRIKIAPSDEELAKLGENFEDNFEEVWTIDIDPGAKPMILWDLEKFPWPVPTQEFDQIHAYEVLEHLGPPQGFFDEVHAYEVLCNLGGVGDWKFFFQLWKQLWDVLKPGGLVCASTPWWESVWAWQDPGHRRVYSTALLTYLSQREYVNQIGKTAMTDYRAVWPPPYSFETRYAEMVGADPKRAGFNFIVQKVEFKPEEVAPSEG